LYDLATKSWEEVAPMAEARSDHGVAVLDGKLYAVGGYSGGDGSYLSSVERYDPTTNAWEAVAPLAASRAAVSLAVLDGKLYAVGGYDDGGNRISSVERYDPSVGAWEAVAPLAAARTKAFDCLDVVAVVSVLVAPRRGVC
jgi:N-acetylneuraminic acid mutarotase